MSISEIRKAENGCGADWKGTRNEVGVYGPRSLSNNSFLETKNATQYPTYSNLDFVVELLTSLHSPNYAYRLEYCLSDRLLVLR